MRKLLLVLIVASACAKKDAIEYTPLKPIKGQVEVSLEAPKAWGKYLKGAGEAESSWSIELVHPENRLINIDIKKYAVSPKTKGFPVQTAAGLREEVARLPKTQVGPVEPLQTAGAVKMQAFPFEGDYLQVSGAGAPKMKGIDAFFEKNGFLYVIDYAVPIEEFDKHRPVFQHVVDTLALHDL